MSSFEVEGRDWRLTAAPGPGGSSSRPAREEPNFAEKILALLEQIRDIDKTMDEARAAKILNIKKAVTAGRYHVSAAEFARRLIDQIDEP